MNEDWTALEYERERKRFVESRMLHRSVYLHASLIFAGTWLAGWALSWFLLHAGVENLPSRYAICFAVSYGVFLLLVRAWADEMRKERGADFGWDAGSFASGDAEGCLIVLAAWAIGLVAAGIFAMLGGMPLLLEVAFEVVFAGVVVRRARRAEVIGDWLGALVARTWVHALAAGVILVAIAAYVQNKVPGAHTLREALTILMKP